ncbi:serine/threonine-protein kinase [Antrihabitans stalactiti]|uniref:non-specific serine/threonine protein kinase n=1 Tax=Antrihabitans stalactiti TaxID=2584121 RepID=A0A848KD86_9NOCA|nr:serine/threonine-protein kinase [Antrihabitans stalactiti]NMN96805.1 serine/threonine protein kinase [Antrihabitans stalactiti]
MTCAEPGCGGTVVDGYCEVCGTAPQAAPAQASTRSTATAANSTTARTSSRSVRTNRSKSTRSSSRGHLGAGMVDVPRAPRVDPTTAMMVDPQVAENKRFCSSCGNPVGRGRDGRPGRSEGFCANCRTKFSFTPKLVTGDVVGGQYEVRGCLAHGGLGWIYLAVDRNVNNRWVVLKGLLNSGDADAMAAAVAERRFLAEVEHPSIVKIHNFVEHKGSDGVAVGYIVMEYVGGTSLKQILKRHTQETGEYLPPEQAVAYIVEMLPALGYLHTLGVAYCDFKPDNVMQTDEQLKLIDLGAVVSMDDEDSAIYGTIGYQAPEIAETGPTVATEIYTVGRTLAVLVTAVPQERGHFVEQLPGPESVPVFATHPSLFRAILRATNADPSARFASTEEMADQLTGVLREILARNDGTPRPGMSAYFSPQRAAFGVGSGAEASIDPAHVIAALPVPLVDPTDSGAALLATTSGTKPAHLEHALETASGATTAMGKVESIEIPLRLVRAALETGDHAEARSRLDGLEQIIPGDWRIAWYRGQADLLNGAFDQAQQEFDGVLTALPGELAPKMALGAVAELRGDAATATEYYEAVWRTDRSFVSTAFGLARQRSAAGDRAGATQVLDEVPSASSLFTEAQIAGVETQLDGLAPEQLNEDLLREAGSRVEALNVESTRRRATIRLKVFDAALAWLHSGGRNRQGIRLLGVDLTEAGVRTGIERCYRDLARETPDYWERFTLVDRANAMRPRTTL